MTFVFPIKSVFSDFLLYYSILTFEFLALLMVAIEWPDLMLQWHATEEIFLRKPYQLDGSKMSTKIRLAGLLILIAVIS